LESVFSSLRSFQRGPPLSGHAARPWEILELVLVLLPLSGSSNSCGFVSGTTPIGGNPTLDVFSFRAMSFLAGLAPPSFFGMAGILGLFLPPVFFFFNNRKSFPPIVRSVFRNLTSLALVRAIPLFFGSPSFNPFERILSRWKLKLRKGTPLPPPPPPPPPILFFFFFFSPSLSNVE